MRRIFIIILGIILFSGCAGLRTLQESEEPEGNFVELARLGVNTVDINNELVVKALQKDFPAERAGVKRGDVFVSIDGKIIITKKAFYFLMDNKQRGDHVLLVIRRNGKQITFDIETRMIKVRPTEIKIHKLLDENKKVTIAVVVSEVKNSYHEVKNPYQNVPKDWVDSVRNNLQSDHESGLLSGFGEDEKFSVVDRARLKQILDGFQFSQLGFVSDKLRAKIGEMTGATHILDISFSRLEGRFNDRDDILNARLVEIESGKVLAVDQIITH